MTKLTTCRRPSQTFCKRLGKCLWIKEVMFYHGIRCVSSNNMISQYTQKYLAYLKESAGLQEHSTRQVACFCTPLPITGDETYSSKEGHAQPSDSPTLPDTEIGAQASSSALTTCFKHSCKRKTSKLTWKEWNINIETLHDSFHTVIACCSFKLVATVDVCQSIIQRIFDLQPRLKDQSWPRLMEFLGLSWCRDVELPLSHMILTEAKGKGLAIDHDNWSKKYNLQWGLPLMSFEE